MASVFKRKRDRQRKGASWYIAYVDENGVRSKDAETVTVKNPRAILVSAGTHEILEFNEGEACL